MIKIVTIKTILAIFASNCKTVRRCQFRWKAKSSRLTRTQYHLYLYYQCLTTSCLSTLSVMGDATTKTVDAWDSAGASLVVSWCLSSCLVVRANAGSESYQIVDLWHLTKLYITSILVIIWQNTKWRFGNSFLVQSDNLGEMLKRQKSSMWFNTTWCWRSQCAVGE